MRKRSNASAATILPAARPLIGTPFFIMDVGASEVSIENLEPGGRRDALCLAYGRVLGRILDPDTVSNIYFGGLAKHQSSILASTNLYAIMLNQSAAQRS